MPQRNGSSRGCAQAAALVTFSPGPIAITRTIRATAATTGPRNRTKEEIESWKVKDKDPIARTVSWLLTQGVAQQELDAIGSEARKLMEGAVEAARASPLPAVSATYTDVQDIGAPQ
jgi:TPP-dependent pyruvate/acetoin dehydrogenase alpha subunit